MRREQLSFEQGQTIDRYQLLLPVETGGAWRAWAARLRGTLGFEKLVTLRVPTGPGSLEQERWLWQEARLASRLQHPHVVQYLDVVKHDGLSCLITEWVHGRSLAGLLRDAPAAGAIPLGVAVQVILQALRGLQAVHGLAGPNGRPLGLVHGDLSPHSLVIDTAGTVKLVELGLAGLRTERPRPHAGTELLPSFAAPELARRESADLRADIFSLGVMLHLLTTGEHPAPPKAAPTRLAHGYPSALEKVVLRALAPERELRFQSAAEMLEQLVLAFPGYASEEELARLLRHRCGGSLARERRRIDEALAQCPVTVRRPARQNLASASEITPDSLSPSHLTLSSAEPVATAPWKSRHRTLFVASAVFVASFVLTLVFSSSSPNPPSPSAAAPNGPVAHPAAPVATPLPESAPASSPIRTVPAPPTSEPSASAEPFGAPGVPQPATSAARPLPRASSSAPPALRARPAGRAEEPKHPGAAARRYGI